MPQLTPENQDDFYRIIGELFKEFDEIIQNDIRAETIARISEIAVRLRAVFEYYGVAFLLLYPEDASEAYWLAFTRLRVWPDIIKPYSEKEFWKEFPRRFLLLKQSFETSPLPSEKIKDPVLLQDREPLKNLMYSSPFEMFLATIQGDAICAFSRTHRSVACVRHSLLEGLLTSDDTDFLNKLPPP